MTAMTLLVPLASTLAAAFLGLLAFLACRAWRSQTAAVAEQITVLASIRKPPHHARKHFRRAA